MKYIRTKDGRIYKIWKDTGIDSFVAEGEITTRNGDYIGSFKGFVPVGYDKVIAQADTIEDLCDEFVAKKDNSKPFVIKRYEIYSNLQFGFIIYGAVWVGPDLHAVAKMNDKGELELL